ncbi:ImmA/IrrE family metallo-endopeptidase [Corallococcus sp. EGB]|uniref:ImmA/IrrE family metallo-endopeptidase n=1 Tax=Corallococcus sp. EGB TaxID=1521117 RepID=UPI001CBB5676|nr:ImmA/IrrE family metallo-endopeptidase [Corallococcus sp. EGB]
MSTKVPFLSDAQIESAAQELLRRYAKWKGEAPRPPIPVDAIAEGVLGLSLEMGDLRTKLGKPDVLGATWLDDALVVIDSSLEGNEGRYCFTLSHELGHWQLHRPLREMDKVTFPLFSREPGAKATAAIVCRDGQRDPAEIQADKFSAFLLMPASDVRAAVKHVSGGPLAIDNLLARKKADERISELRDFASEVIAHGGFTNVSNQAMQIRLETLKLVVDGAQGRLF